MVKISAFVYSLPKTILKQYNFKFILKIFCATDKNTTDEIISTFKVLTIVHDLKIGITLKGVCVTFARASLFNEASVLQEGTLLHSVTFARASHLHGVSVLHGDSFARASLLHGVKRKLFCTEHHFLNTF